ncbi:copine-5-like [Notolabrus celidotus]|uniref:copine-5-like n=1 Tax=Notolabrus celidotus TaxID=1203425 RepID=UPI00148F60C5|nr:copine-5-like [Notolabrus celidotus]
MNMACIGDADPFTAAIPATKVELTVSCRNLLDRDTFSKSDPICVLYIQGIANREWREFGRTEVIDNTLNPDFVRKFILDYFFEERQNLRFDLYDLDCKSDNLSKHDFLGQAFSTLGEIVGSLGSRLEKPLIGIPGKKCGTIIVRAEELSNCRESVMLQFCGNKLDKKDFFGKSDPFLVFYRSNEDGSFTICHKTEVVKNTLDPVWQAFKIPVRALCNGDYDRSIKVEVYDWDRDGGHDFIGEFSTSYREMSRSQSQFHIYEGRYASAVTDGSQYFILLIISDGVITDMAQTKESIVNAASLPMSIIIVGVGPAEFDEMIELDGDEERISSQGRYAERDIVQFVPFRDYIDRRGNHILSMARLAKEVLAEIPDQFLSYMRTRGIKPGPLPPPYTTCPPPALHPLLARRVSRI